MMAAAGSDLPAHNARAGQGESSASDISEHIDAVISGRLRLALVLTLVVLVVELAGGIWSHSLALLSDAGHVTTDIFALGLAWFAVEQTRRPADARRSFGYQRAESVIRSVEDAVCHGFGIGHTTIQVEYKQACAATADHVLEHNHAHRKLARSALGGRRRTPLVRKAGPAPVAAR